MDEFLLQEQGRRLHQKLDDVIAQVKSQGRFEDMVAVLRTGGFELLLLVLQVVVQSQGVGELGPTTTCPCGCGNQLRCQGRDRKRWVQTLFGAVLLVRSYYHGCVQGGGYFPRDRELGLRKELLEPSLQKSLVLMGVLCPFGVGADALRRTTGFEVSAKKAYTLGYTRGLEAWALEYQRAQQAWEQREQLRRNARRRQRGRVYVLVDGTGVGIEGQQEFKECKSALIFWESDLVRVRSRSQQRRVRRRLVRKHIISHVGPKEQFERYLWLALIDQGVLEARHGFDKSNPYVN